MKFRCQKVNDQPKLMIIPMIDIIFFLLVFFMMTTLYMVEQHTIPVNLPQATATQQNKQHSVNVTVTMDGRIIFDQEEVSFEVLRQRANAELTKQPDSLFVLRADKQAEYGKVIAALDQLKLAGVHKVAVATELKAR